LVKKAEVKEYVEYEAERFFDDMPLNNKLKANIRKKGYSKPTQIQDETLETLLKGKNLVGVAKTGTGKTASFLIPIVQQLLEKGNGFESLIIVPTRELALQIEQEFKSIASGLGIYAACFIGGTSVNRDMQKLKRKHQIIIGTPGRLLDLSNRRALKLRSMSTLVLDEFDRMLDMGFVNDIKKIIKLMPNRKQTMLFSATIDKKQKPLIDEMVKRPVEVKVSDGSCASESINQDVIKVPQGTSKFKILTDLISGDGFDKVLIFAETKRLANRISQQLNRIGILSDMIHGNKSQNYRVKALDKFKSGQVQVLVATDVAARGIDVDNVSHVINYQLPLNFESYVHRIGRTGRAGKVGQAYTFID